MLFHLQQRSPYKTRCTVSQVPQQSCLFTVHHSSVSLWACCCFSASALGQWPEHSGFSVWQQHERNSGSGLWLPLSPFYLTHKHADRTSVETRESKFIHVV